MEQTRQQLETQVLERAAKDPGFREQFKQDPRGTTSRDFGVEVPSDITIEVVEETSSKVYLVLPPAPAQSGGELTDHELEEVAGGRDLSRLTLRDMTCSLEPDLCTCLSACRLAVGARRDCTASGRCRAPRSTPGTCGGQGSPAGDSRRSPGWSRLTPQSRTGAG